MSKPESRQTPFTSEYRCSQCGNGHSVIGTMVVIPQPILFGGAGAGTHWRVSILCPEKNLGAEEIILLKPGAGAKVLSVDVSQVSKSPQPAQAPSPPPGDPGAWLGEELKEWRKSSALNMRAFGTSMITTCTGGVAIYFAVLKFIGTEKIGGGWQWILILPPILLLLSATGFGWAIRPTLGFVDLAEYSEFRRNTLMRTHTRINSALVILLLALMLAILVFGRLIWK
jgi:hypothetical protein